MLTMKLIATCCIIVVFINKVEGKVHVEMSATSNGSPDFYVNDINLFTCKGYDFENLQSLVISYVTSLSRWERGCVKDNTTKKWVAVNYPRINVDHLLHAPQITDDYCAAVGDSSGFSVSVNITIRYWLVTGWFECNGIQKDGTYEQDTVIIKTMRVEPKELKMEFIPPMIIENQPFRVNCSSVGGSPHSAYKYEIRSGSKTVSQNGRYTPSQSDREGLVVQCVDTVHNNWKAGNTSLSSKVYASYIANLGNSTLYIYLDRSQTHALNCSQHVVGYPRPYIFQWFVSGDKQVSNTSDYYISPLEEGESEVVTCLANNGIVNDTVETTWNITWNSKGTTADPPTAKAGLGTRLPVIIASSGLFLLFIVFTVTTQIYRRRKKGTLTQPIDSRPILSRRDSVETDNHTYSYISDSHFLEGSYESVQTTPANSVYGVETTYCNVPATRKGDSQYVQGAFLVESPNPFNVQDSKSVEQEPSSSVTSSSVTSRSNTPSCNKPMTKSSSSSGYVHGAFLAESPGKSME